MIVVLLGSSSGHRVCSPRAKHATDAAFRRKRTFSAGSGEIAGLRVGVGPVRSVRTSVRTRASHRPLVAPEAATGSDAPRMAPSTHEDGESLEFLRRRVANFGLFTGAFVLAFWLFRWVTGDEFASAGMATHLAAAALLLVVWPVLNFVEPTRTLIRVVESVSVCGSSALFIVMGMNIPRMLTRP